MQIYIKGERMKKHCAFELADASELPQITNIEGSDKRTKNAGFIHTIHYTNPNVVHTMTFRALAITKQILACK